MWEKLYLHHREVMEGFYETFPGTCNRSGPGWMSATYQRTGTQGTDEAPHDRAVFGGGMNDDCYDWNPQLH